MATNDTELIAEVRLLTEYDESIIPTTDMESLVALTRRELSADLGSTIPDFYSDLSSERALFWLTCIFAKVKTGEIEAPEFSIGELKVQRDSMGQQSSLWFNNFLKHYRGMSGGAPVGHIKSNRPDRDYRFDN
jgi:hypothetical protein